MIAEPTNKLTISQKCQLLEVPRSSFYYKKRPESEFNQTLMRLIDEIHTKHLTWGSRKIRDYLRALEHKVNRKRVQRLMTLMQISVIYPKKRRYPDGESSVYPYKLRNLVIW